jgi:transposase InsO family protein
VQIDATEPFGKSNGILMTAIDDHTRWVKAEIYRGNNSQNAAGFLERLVRELSFPITAVRVDNGAEFKDKFIKKTKELGIKLIRNPVGSPQKNGKVERMHRTIEEECLWRVGAKPSKLTEAQYQLNRYLAWYNHKRKHLGHGMNTSPRLKLEKWLINNLEEDYQERNLADVNETLIRYIH